jgi:3-oxoacyl-(acyl-carrier-protein) synthase
MAVNTPLGDTLDGFLANLLAGKSAITRWHSIDSSRIYAKVGGDLGGYDTARKMRRMEALAPAQLFKRLRRLIAKAPWSTKLTMLLAADAFLDAGFCDSPADPARAGTIVAGHNINSNYVFEAGLQFREEPDYIDPLYASIGIDTGHPACVSELLGLRGPLYTVGAACASGNTALRCAVDEIRHHDIDTVVITGAVLDLSPMELHSMALMGALSFLSFNDAPEQASRPFDMRREGFVPSHGGACLVVEELESAQRRGARIHAEVVGIEINSDANHRTKPCEDSQTRLVGKLLRDCAVAPEQIDYISAHATSTPLGDVAEIRSIKRVFGAHAPRLRINAPKSMLGHTCWASPTVETVAAILQMNSSTLHPSINIEQLDPEVDLEVCAGGAMPCDVRYFLKNSFGFGGINSVSLFKRWEG